MQAQRLFDEAQKNHQRGKLEEARKRYVKILEIEPDHDRARLFLAICHHQTGRNIDALREAQRAMRDDCDDPSLWSNYGIILKGAGELRLAEEAYRQALNLKPDLHSVKSNLATLLLMRGAVPDAEQLFLELTAILEDPAPWLNLTRIALGREDDALANEYLQKAEDLGPKHPDVPLLKAKLYKLERADEKCFSPLRQVLELKPSHADAWLMIQGLDAAAVDLEVLEELTGKLVDSGVQDLKTLTSAVDVCRRNFLWEFLPKLEDLLTSSASQEKIVAPGAAAGFTVLGANVPQWVHRKVSESNWLEIKSRRKGETINADWPDLTSGKINVGFLSSDLRGHAVGFLIVGLLEKLPKEKINWFAYSNSFPDATDSRERVRNSFDRFINVATLSDVEVAKRIARDNIHILIDLNGMTRDTRAQVLHFRPAPVQITWLGMPGTLGAVDDCDYLIGDPWTTYEGNHNGFSENIIVLPRSYQPNDHVPPDMQLAKTRKEHDLPEGVFVFCSFNQHYKFSPDTLECWIKILRDVEESVLWLLKPKSQSIETRLLDLFVKNGVSASRIIFAHHTPQAEHIARISHADLILDTWPYNAHTTCSDALRAGVPVVTLPGETFASRVAASILDYGNLAEWIVETPDAYVEKAVAFAQQPRHVIEAHKHQVCETYWQSAMVDNTAFGKQLEALCHQLHLHHAQSNSAHPWRLEPDLTLVPLDLATAPVPAASAPKTPIASPVPSMTSPRAKTGSSVNQRLDDLARLQKEVIGLDKPPLLVDVGAAAIDAPVGFETLADHGLVKLLGFEPSPESYQRLQKESRSNREYLQTALGDGDTAELSICQAPGMNSLLAPDQKVLDMFPQFTRWGTVKSTETLLTVPLAEVEQARDMAMMKCDTQGSELTICQHAGASLKRAVMLQLELSPTPLYQGEASLFEVGHWLEQQGWMLHTFSNLNKRLLKPFGTDESPFGGKHHLLQVDAVFIPDLRHWDRLSEAQLKELAFLAHAMYQSHDLAQRALWALDQRDDGQRAEAYVAYLKEGGYHA